MLLGRSLEFQNETAGFFVGLPSDHRADLVNIPQGYKKRKVSSEFTPFWTEMTAQPIFRF
jgi:hypothetical protein